MSLNLEYFTEVPGDPNVGSCYQIDLEKVPGARETVVALKGRAVMLIELEENDLPKDLRSRYHLNYKTL